MTLRVFKNTDTVAEDINKFLENEKIVNASLDYQEVANIFILYYQHKV